MENNDISLERKKLEIQFMDKNKICKYIFNYRR